MPDSSSKLSFADFITAFKSFKSYILPFSPIFFLKNMNQLYPSENAAQALPSLSINNRKNAYRLPKFFSLVSLLLCFQLSHAQPVTLLPSDIPDGTGVGSFTKTISSQTFTFTPSSSTNNYVTYANDIGTEGFGGLYAFDGETYDGTEFTLSSPTGYSFDYNSFQYISDRGTINLTVTLTFTDGSTDAKTYTLTGNNLVQTFSGFTTAANDITSIKFVSDALLYYNNFDITDVKPTITLPLNWLGFTASTQKNNITLNWKTAAENNTKGFIIQHSTDGHHWSNIGNVAAYAGESGAQSYTYLHTNPANGANLYRLQQQDIDGTSSYSKVIMIDFSSGNQLLSVYPNPVVNRNLNIKLQQPSVIQIYNNIGVLVLQKSLPAGTSSLQLPNLSSGTYYIKTNSQNVLVVLP